MNARCLLIGLVVALNPAQLLAGHNEIIVNCDVTPAGHKLPQPTAQAPLHYLLVMAGHSQIGEKVAGEPAPPSSDEVKQLVVKALASQHMHGVTKNTTVPPELMIVVHWGSARPEDLYFNPENPFGPKTGNRREMDALVIGSYATKMSVEEVGRSALISAAGDDRYFAVVTAFDWKALDQPKGKQKKIALWQARMSIPTSRTTLTAVLPALVKHGTPFLGRQTDRPHVFDVDDIPEGRVTTGPLVEVKDPGTSPTP